MTDQEREHLLNWLGSKADVVNRTGVPKSTAKLDRKLKEKIVSGIAKCPGQLADWREFWRDNPWAAPK